MTIDKFSTERFENELPVRSDDGKKLWTYVGMVQGERVYNMDVSEFARIRIRSSIDESGFAADTGQDSIRLWIEILDQSGQWAGAKSMDAYTTRVNGWEGRMEGKLRDLWAMASRVKRPIPLCAKCQRRQGVWFTKKGANEGRPASKCFGCQSGFTWMDEEVKGVPEPTQESERPAESDLLDEIDNLLRKKKPVVKAKIGIDEKEPEYTPLSGTPNVQQELAIEAPMDRAVRMIAGPGSGKSKTLIWRIQKLLDSGVDPENILAVTFNKTMADELLNRALAAFPEYRESAGASQICTIHALCFRLLREYGENRNVPKTWQIKRMVQEIAERLWPVEQRPGWEEIVNAIANAKYRGMVAGEDAILYSDWFGKFHGDRLARARVELDRRLKSENLLPFYDMLYMVDQLIAQGDSIVEIWRNRFQYVLIDEAQDTSGQAMRILSELGKRAQMYIVGDTDQLLYRFTGATPEANLQDGFDELYPNGMTYMLETNYRSTQEIIDTCNRLIMHNYQGSGGPYEGRFRKHLVSRENAPKGLPVTYDEYMTQEEEAVGVTETIREHLANGMRPGDIFVGSRTKAQLGYLEGPLMAAGIPFINITGGSFWLLKHVRDVYSYVFLAADHGDKDAFARVYNIASNEMVQPWGQNEGEYCTHRYLGRQFLNACDGNYENAYDALGRRRSWQPGVEDLTSFMEDLSLSLRMTGISGALKFVVDECYEKWLRYEEGLVNTDEAENGKLADLQTLIEVSQRFVNIEDMRDFIEKAIKAAQDAKDKNWDDYVVLSTVHRLKGLERRVVFGIGWSEGCDESGEHNHMYGLLPHTFSMVDPPQVGVLNFPNSGRVEDERCIAFVLISRAMEQCHLSGISLYRNGLMAPSRFLYEAGIL